MPQHADIDRNWALPNSTGSIAVAAWSPLQRKKLGKDEKEMEGVCEVTIEKESTANRQRGVTSIEYSIMLVLIAMTVALAAPNISSAITSVLAQTSSVLQ